MRKATLVPGKASTRPSRCKVPMCSAPSQLNLQSRCRRSKEHQMQSILTTVMADVHAAELHEHAGAGRAVRGSVRTRTHARGLGAALRGYLGHAFTADEQPLRRAGRG